MEKSKITYEFPVVVYGQLERYNDVLSKARCRIFYKYENRNGSYITDEFAEKLLSSVPYTPIKGIYEDGDFTDHGNENAQGRIYGIVPAEPNISWEYHKDEDGQDRLYACVDVLLFTALYDEANEILGKAQSMELFAPSIKYHWKKIDGIEYVVFDEGSFLGLQVLGTRDGIEVEPCFEGAAFYSLQNSIAEAIQKIKEYSYEGRQEKMELNFRLSDGEKYQALNRLLNPDCTEEGGWICDYAIDAVYDDYALVYEYDSGSYFRAYYKKDDEANTVEITEKVPVVVMDLTSAEAEVLDKLREINGGFAAIDEKVACAHDNANKCEEYGLKLVESNEEISTLKTEKDSLVAERDQFSLACGEKDATIESLKAQVEELTAFKLGIERQQKLNIIDEYTGKLSSEILNTYKEDLDKYTMLDLDKELAYELKKNNVSLFDESENPLIPKDVTSGGIEEILTRYK